MNMKSIAIATAVVAVLAGCKDKTPPAPTQANITLVEAVTETVKKPHQVCKDVVVTSKLPLRMTIKLLVRLVAQQLEQRWATKSVVAQVK